MNIFSWLDPAVRAPLAVAMGAIPGALSRYYLGVKITEWLGSSFPYGTATANLTGALVMGFCATLFLERIVVSQDLQLLVAVGFLGSYTTFSSYTLETANLWRSDNSLAALFYWAGSAFLGVLSLQIGSLLARKLS